MAEEARLVGTGTFRIDFRAALEKLRRYRDPKAGPLMFWTRCAVAAGASRLEESLDGPVLRVVFDGEPLPEPALDDPLGALFSDDEPHPAARQLALGVLHAWRPGLLALTVESGVGTGRRTAALGPDGATRVAAAAPGGKGTTITLTLKKKDPTLASHPRTEGDVACAPHRLTWTPACRIERRVDGERVGAEGQELPEAGEVDLAEGGFRARFGPSSAPRGPSLVDVYHHGVFVDSVRGLGPGPAVYGKVDDSALPLDISQRSAVDGPRAALLARLVDRARAALADHLARAVSALLPREAARLRAAGRAPAMAPFPKEAMRWLRAACASPMMSARAASRVLSRAPLMLDNDLVPVTLERLSGHGRAAVVQAFDVRGFPDALNVWAQNEIAEADLPPLLEAASTLRERPAPGKRRRRSGG